MLYRFKSWADKYGPIFSLKIGQSTMVVLSDPEAVRHLFYRKSALFADRPIDEQWIRATDNELMVMMPHGPIWKAMRKITAQTLSAKYLDGALAKVQEAEYAKSKQWMTKL